MGLFSCFSYRHASEDDLREVTARPISHHSQQHSQRMHDWVEALPADASSAVDDRPGEPEARDERVKDNGADAPDERKPKTGMRKRGASVAKAEYEPSWETQRKASVREKKPLQYLYFGEGGPRVSGETSRTNAHATRTNAASVPTIRVEHFEPVQTVPGRDASGFQSSGVNSQITAPMGYQNLTYGGALQGNYSETSGT